MLAVHNWQKILDNYGAICTESFISWSFVVVFFFFFFFFFLLLSFFSSYFCFVLFFQLGFQESSMKYHKTEQNKTCRRTGYMYMYLASLIMCLYMTMQLTCAIIPQPLSCRGQGALSNIDEICPLAIPNQISLISMHVPSLVKIP